MHRYKSHQYIANKLWNKVQLTILYINKEISKIVKSSTVLIAFAFEAREYYA